MRPIHGRWPKLAVAAAPAVSLAWLTMHAGNAALHVGECASQRRYNPGMATSLALFGPMAANGLRRVEPSGVARAAGVAIGAAISLGMLRVMRRRAAGMRAAEVGPAG